MTPLSKVLYVEDEPDIRTIAELALGTLGGLEVLTCPSADAAFAAIPAFGPDLILLDVMMPGMNGVAMLHALRAEPATSSIPVVFMTARNQPVELARYRSLGALDVISKPFDPLVLADQVRAIWRRAHAGT